MGQRRPANAFSTSASATIIVIGYFRSTASAELTAPVSFTTGTLQVTVHPEGDPSTAVAVLDKTIALADRAMVEQPRLWTVDTSAFAAGTFVLRLTARDVGGHTAETAVLFEVVAR